MKRYISGPRVEGKASRQAHADLPAGTYEREISKEGFFGPAAHFYHRHPPTGWVGLRGAAAAARLRSARSSRRDAATRPGRAPELLHNATVRMRFWRCRRRMAHLARNADGDELLFVHAGRGELFCDYGHLAFEAGDYIVHAARHDVARRDARSRCDALLIEATND